MKNETILRQAKGCDSPEVANDLKAAAAWEWRRRQDDAESERYEKRMELAMRSIIGLAVFLLVAIIFAALHIR